MTIKQVMDSWTTEKGYPVLNVRRSYDTGDVIISQERFISDRKVPNTNVWMLPYNYVNQSVADFHDTNTYSWLTTKAARISTDVPDHLWIIFNIQQVGFYRVNYDERNWELITNSLITNWASVNRLNRAQLIDDAFWLARSERLDLEIFMKLLTYLKDEREYAPWTAASNALSYFNGKLRGTNAYHDFLVMVHRLIKYVYSTLSVATVSETESMLHKYLKQTITNWACIVGDLECLRLTKEALENEALNGVMVHPDVSSVVYCHGLRDADENVFVYLYNRIYKTQNWAFRMQIIDALGCSRNQKFLVDFLHTALGSGSEINYKASERTRIIQSVYSGSRVGVDALIEFLSNTNNVNDFALRLGINTLNSAIANIASRTNNAEELEKVCVLIGYQWESLLIKLFVSTARQPAHQLGIAHHSGYCQCCPCHRSGQPRLAAEPRRLAYEDLHRGLCQYRRAGNDDPGNRNYYPTLTNHDHNCGTRPRRNDHNAIGWFHHNPCSHHDHRRSGRCSDHCGFSYAAYQCRNRNPNQLRYCSIPK